MDIQVRRKDKSENGVFGELFIDGSRFCTTLERPDLNNEPEVSCIPTGEYKCHRHTSLKFGEVWELEDVPGRADILIHPANLYTELRGCIALGTNRGIVNGQKGIINAREAVKEFMDKTAKEEFITVKVVEV